MSLTNKAVAEMLRMDCKAKFPYLVDIILSDGAEYHYSNTDDAVIFEGNVYSPCSFNIKPPDIKENSIGNGTFTITCVDQSIIKVVREENKQKIKIRFVASIIYNDDMSIESVEAIEDTVFSFSDISWTDISVSGTLVFDENMSILIPCDIANAQTTPALV